MKKASNKMATAKKKKEVGPKERVVLKNLGETAKRSKVETTAPVASKGGEEVCSCGGAVYDGATVYQCPECSWTWCNMCLKRIRSCPVCGAAGIKTE